MGFEIATSGMLAQEAIVTNTTHSLANSSTTAFKKSVVLTQSIMPQTLKQAGSLSSATGTIANVGTYLGGGVRVAGTIPVLTQGSVQQTGRDTDMAVVGNGYFQVELPDGTVGYTRDGSFNKGADGTLETIDGYKLVPGITIPENATAIMISANGEVEARIAGETENQNLGQIQLAVFLNASGLEPITGNYYTETAASGGAIVGNPGEGAYGRIHQRALESSNVDAVTEVTNLIKGQRTYELCAKALSTFDQMAQAVNSKIGV